MKPLLGRQFIAALVEAGVLREDDKIRRVVIDVKITDFVAIHVERVGDERMIDVIPPMTGVSITTTQESEA